MGRAVLVLAHGIFLAGKTLAGRKVGYFPCALCFGISF